ncbi:hypothetical protein QJS66_07135 [Kocuria rhizophila]|nr:hypothetical protein QJS66_07135 [Kocuria rhizophila]
MMVVRRTRSSRRVRPLLEIMGARVVRCGGNGIGPGREDLQRHGPGRVHGGGRGVACSRRSWVWSTRRSTT